MSGMDVIRVKECLTALNKTERYIVLLYFADGLTLPEISAVLDVSTQHVTQTLAEFREKVAKLIDPAEKQVEFKAFADRWLATKHSAAV